MLEENAKVITLLENSVLVEIVNRSACTTCSARKGCGQSLLSRITGSKRTRIEVSNAMNLSLKEGEEVVLGIEESSLLKATAVAYLLPLLGLLQGSVFGKLLDVSEFLIVFMALFGFVIGICLVYMHGYKTGKQDNYQPLILRSLSSNSQPVGISVVTPL